MESCQDIIRTLERELAWLREDIAKGEQQMKEDAVFFWTMLISVFVLMIAVMLIINYN